jgi:fructose-specific phosphotransferase system IIC component
VGGFIKGFLAAFLIRIIDIYLVNEALTTKDFVRALVTGLICGIAVQFIVNERNKRKNTEE